MFWNAKKKKSDKEFQEWKLQEKRALVDAHLKEIGDMHDRIKTRLFSVLSLSVTLESAAAAGAYSGSRYAFPCSIMLCGFFFVIIITIIGLWSTTFTTQNISPQTFDEIIDEIHPIAKNKSEGLTEIIATFYDISSDNFGKARRDQSILKVSWCLLLLTPITAWVLSLWF